MNEEVARLLSRPTASVQEVGRLCFGLAKDAAYAAAARGDFFSIRIGRKIVVPTAPLRRLLGIDSDAA